MADTAQLQKMPARSGRMKTYTRTGAMHLEQGIGNQDAFSCGERGRYSAMALADGVSTCRAAGPGAETAASAAARILLKKPEFFLSCKEEEIADFLLDYVLYQLEALTRESGGRIEDYSSTLAAVLFDSQKRQLLFVSLGDSLVMAAGGGQCRLLSAPCGCEGGCCVTTTRGAAARMEAHMVDAGFLETALIFSDGAWRRLLHRNRLRPEAEACIAGNNVDGLQALLDRCGNPDDSSFLAMEL